MDEPLPRMVVRDESREPSRPRDVRRTVLRLLSIDASSPAIAYTHIYFALISNWQRCFNKLRSA